ncbi:MAG: hypothetical protein KME27_25455 [Lyngbya sp. HA4199-MV5]|jgi:hypothetical protein|nr:hypothetical protein [Lyngbya sp. HA4199-MV5]
MKIYLTHCSAEKESTLKGTGIATTPAKLYTNPELQAFMQRCQNKGVAWAILSDRYGVWLPNITHEWYEKHPSTVTEEEFRQLVAQCDRTLQAYDEIYFFVRPATFHPFYQKVLTTIRLASRVTQFRDMQMIE